MSQPVTVLIVDDELINIHLFRTYLASEYRIIAANNGEQALQRVQSNPQPDLILLDILMPGMDGFEVCRCLKADAATRDIPIIFLTALSDPRQQIRGFEMGAADYLIKPIKEEILRARIRTHLGFKQAMRPSSGPMKGPT